MILTPLGSSDGEIRLWNYRKGVSMNIYQGHEDKIWALDTIESKNSNLQFQSRTYTLQLSMNNSNPK